MNPSITAAYLARYRQVTAAESAPVHPVTGAQRRFLVSRRLHPQGRPDIVPLFFSFPADAVDLVRLRAAAHHLTGRHTALRARFDTLRGTPVLRVGEPGAEVRRVGLLPGEGAADALRRELLAWPADGPVLRLLLARASDTEDLLAVALDHAACDGQSLGTVTAGLTEAYRERLTATPDDAETAAYRETVELQLAAEERASSPADRAYWAARLAGLRAAPAGRSGAEVRTGLLTDRLPAATGAARGATFPALLDAVGAAARCLLGPERSPVIGYPWGGRPPGAPAVPGCFLNTVAHPAGSGADLEALSAGWWDDLDHADTPFDEVVQAGRGAGDGWSGALDGLLTFEDLHRRPPLVLGGAEGLETHLAGRPLAAPFAVSASQGEDLLVKLAWDRHRYSDDEAHAALAALSSTLRRHLVPTAL